MIDTLPQGHLLAVSTLRTGLTGLGRVNLDEVSASFCRFARHSLKELRPRRVADAFCQIMDVNHAVYLQVLHTDYTEAVHHGTGLLMVKVVTV